MIKDWLRPVRDALEELSEPITFIYRNDDAGWESEKLGELIEHFSRLNLPLDLAVIPAAANPDFANYLREMITRAVNPIRIHQHGYAHCNHEHTGRKYEFGDSRNEVQQLRDISNGQEKLARLFNGEIDPIFTPPWNRCNQSTIRALNRLSFKALSRDISTAELETLALTEIPIHVNWLKRKNGIRLNRPDIAQSIAICIRRRSHVGIMLHHAEMTTDDWNNFEEFIGLLKQNASTKHKNMRELITC